MSFYSRQSFSVSFFHVSLGLTAPHLPSICISHAVLTTPLECSSCPYQRSLLSLKMRLRSSSFASSGLDHTMATSSGLILQICLIMALSLCCKCCRFILQSKLFITSLFITEYSISDKKLLGTDLFPLKFSLYNRVFT